MAGRKGEEGQDPYRWFGGDPRNYHHEAAFLNSSFIANNYFAKEHNMDSLSFEIGGILAE